MSIQTFADHTGDNSTTSFAFSFPYLDDSHVVVQVDQASVSGGAFVTKALTTDYTIQTSPTSAIIFNSAPATGDRIRIKRDSASNTALVDFENGSVLTEVELDRAYLHNLYLNEEIEEGSGKNVMTKNSAGNFEADLAKIVDVADPTLAQDAATKNYVDTRGLQDFDGSNTTSDVNLNNNKLTNVTDPGSNQDAATKNYVDTQDALQVTKAGDSMSGNLAMGGNDITGVNSVRDLIAPAAGSHATNKTYVDAGDADQVNKTGDSMTGALAMGDNKITGLATPTATADATNKSYVDAEIATTLATGVAGGPIGTANIADDAVTADKIANTAVTPGAYTATNLTVDAQGRITAAANGSASPTAAEVKTLYESNADTNEFDDAEQTKLAGIAAGATVNSSDATLLARANHTGTQTLSTISDAGTAAANNTGDFATAAQGLLADSAVQNGDSSIALTSTTGNVNMEIGGATGFKAFIDLKNPSTDDYDVRVISDDSTTLETVHTSRARIEGHNSLGLCAGDTSGGTPIPEMVTIKDGNIGIGGAPSSTAATTLLVSHIDSKFVATGSNNSTVWSQSPQGSAYFILYTQSAATDQKRVNMAVDQGGDGGGLGQFGITWVDDDTTPGEGLIFKTDGSLTIGGAFSASSKSFKIDHPLASKKDTHHLVHMSVESPQADLIYRGKVSLVDGVAQVNIDTASGMTEGTFVALCTDVQCFTSNESNWDAVKGSVAGNILTINCQDSSSTATISWMVVGERQDQQILDTNLTDENGKVIVEPAK